MIYTVLRPLTERKVYLYVSLRCTVSHHKDGTYGRLLHDAKLRYPFFLLVAVNVSVNL